MLPSGCKKGGRDCIYPETSTSTKTSRSGSSRTVNLTSHESPGTSSDESDDRDNPKSLDSVADGEEVSGNYARSTSLSKYGMQQSRTGRFASGEKGTASYDSETPSLEPDKGASPTPSTEGSVNYGTHNATAMSRLKNVADASNLKTDWSHLPLDLQFYLTYFYENITHLHYSLKYDSGDFLRTTFLDAALRHEPLLYALVGFSAFQRTLHTTQGKIQDFLQ